MDFDKRQQRPRAYNDSGHAHELTFSCFRRFKLLSKERTCAWMAHAIERACGKLNYSLWAYVFMPDHVQLIVHPCEYAYNTSDFLKAVKELVRREAVRFLKGGMEVVQCGMVRKCAFERSQTGSDSVGLAGTDRMIE